MRLFLSTVAGVLVSLVPLRASIVFTDFQSSASAGCSLAGTIAGGPIACAAAFTPSATYIMTDAQVEVGGISSLQGNFDLFLYSNNSGLPGSSLGMIGSGSASTTVGIVTLNSPALSLFSGTEYWLVMAPHDGFTLVNWADGGNPVPPDAFDSPFPGSPWTSNSVASSQFQIDGTASTPEPSTLALVVSGMLFVALRRRFTKSSK